MSEPVSWERYSPYMPEVSGDYAVACMAKDPSGKYVRYDQAESAVAGKDKELNKLNVYNGSYHNQILELRELLQTAEAKLAQYEKQVPVMFAGMDEDGNAECISMEKTGICDTPLYAATAPAADQEAEIIERCAKALDAWGDIYGDNAASTVRALSGKTPS